MAYELTYLENLVNQAKLNLCQAFVQQYEQKYGVDLTSLSPSNKEEKQNEEAAAGATAAALDPFEQLEQQKLLEAEQDPEAISFYNAKKHMMMMHLKKKKAIRRNAAETRFRM